jgi:hypothetical protein
MRDWKEVIKENVRYEGFTILEDPVPFNEMFANRDIPLVQVHSTYVFEVDGKEDIVGFSGVFEWKNGEVIPGDFDSYNPRMLVLGYEEDDKCLDILVGNDW